jgi:hypothetical protein
MQSVEHFVQPSYTYEEASTRAENLMNTAGYLDTEENKERLINFMRNRNYTSYHINGNQPYCGKVKMSMTDFILTISILKINMKTFCLKTFISERENTSQVFDGILSDELLEKFPQIDLFAN